MHVRPVRRARYNAATRAERRRQARQAGNRGRTNQVNVIVRLSKMWVALLAVVVGVGVFGFTFWWLTQSPSSAARIDYFQDVTAGSGVDFTHPNSEEAAKYPIP